MFPIRGFFLAACLWFVAAPTASARAADGPGRSPRFVVNLLDYVGADYAVAVSEDGRVLSPSEYEEQREFVRIAREAAAALPETRDSREIRTGLEALEELVRTRASPAAVARQAQAIKKLVVTTARITLAPASWPHLAHGAELYARNCANCHGAEGRGDGPAGRGLDPAPTDFTAAAMGASSPFKSFNVIREGVPGTGMAAFHHFSDRDVWELAFFVNAIRFESGRAEVAVSDGASLEMASLRSDDELLETLPGATPADRRTALAALRRRSGGDAASDALAIARARLQDADSAYQAGRGEQARDQALAAYLDGIEPIEPKLRASAPDFVSSLEVRMAAVRGAIEARADPAAVSAAARRALESVDEAERLLAPRADSPWLSFVIALGILLREGFEAVLVLIALLAVIRTAGGTEARRAAAHVHGGWVAAVTVGVGAWFASGWLLRLSGASRETLEGSIGALAVVVLLSMGFWLHSRTELRRWQTFVDGQVRQALASRNLWGLTAISFFAVFREAFEVVLFLRAVWLDAGDAGRAAMSVGVFVAFAILFVGAGFLVRGAARLPLRKVFALSSALMLVLAFVIAGKSVHAFQETGLIGIRMLGSFRIELLGVYATAQTLLAQLAVLAVSAVLYVVGRRPL